jgi:hypothetical protein
MAQDQYLDVVRGRQKVNVVCLEQVHSSAIWAYMLHPGKFKKDDLWTLFQFHL